MHLEGADEFFYGATTHAELVVMVQSLCLPQLQAAALSARGAVRFWVDFITRHEHSLRALVHALDQRPDKPSAHEVGAHPGRRASLQCHAWHVWPEQGAPEHFRNAVTTSPRLRCAAPDLPAVQIRHHADAGKLGCALHRPATAMQACGSLQTVPTQPAGCQNITLYNNLPGARRCACT